MKKITNFIFIASLAIGIVSCNKDKSFEEDLAGLKQVIFPEMAEQVISSERTGQTKTIGTVNKNEVIQTIKVQKTLRPIELVTASDLDVIYPGSVLDGASFIEGAYTPLIINNPKEIVLSTSLQGAQLPVKITSLPKPSEVRQSVNDLVYANGQIINRDNTASYLTYISNEVSTKESFNKTFGIHSKINVLSAIDANFSYTESKLNINSKTYVLIKVRQIFYNVTVDPKPASEWGSIQNVGSYEPVYISSVDYGRVAHLLIETKEDIDELSKTIKAGISAKFARSGGSVDVESVKKVEKLFSERKIQIMLVGGPLSQAKLVSNLDTFRDYLEMPKASELVESATPIGYKVRTLKDNKEVDVRVTYTEQRFAYE